MRMSAIFLLWLSLIGLPSFAFAQGLTVGATPSWVVGRPFAASSVTAFDGPVTYLLVDRQDSFVGPQPQFYIRLVGLVNNPAGLDELSQITAEFDPSFEKIIFHELNIIRNQGKPKSALNLQSFEMIRREKDSERQIFDGSITASYLLHDLRVGDIIDYSYSVVGQQPLLGQRRSGIHDLNWSVPVLEAHVRQIWPKDTSLRWTVSRPDLSIQQKIEGSQLITEWTGRKLPPTLEEDMVPAGLDPMDTYHFSTWRNWAEVADWALPFYQVDAKSEMAIQELAAGIRKQFSDPKSQVEEAIRFVQDEVRYVGIEIGSGSFKPRQPSEVLARRFGDCKDKALLLTSLVKTLGYEAFPILVKSEGGSRLEHSLPTPLAFNHVVVGVKAPNQSDVYWVDGTLQSQGLKLETKDYPQLLIGLPLQAKTQELLRQNLTLIPEGRVEYLESFVTSSFHEPVQLNIKSRFIGWQAEKMRSELANQGIAVVGDGLANYVKKLYPTANSVADPRIEDDRLANVLAIEENYTIPELWLDDGEGVWKLEIAASAYINSYLSQPQKVKRLNPVFQAYPLVIHHEQEIVIPAKWDLKSESHSIENGSFRYQFDQSVQNHSLRFVHVFTSLSGEIAVEDLPKYLQDGEDVRQQLNRFVHFRPAATPSVWQRFFLVFPQVIGLFVLFLVAIGWQLQQDDLVQGQIIWPKRSLLFMLLLLIFSSGAFALFWYVDADRRLNKIGHRILPQAVKWLSVAIFAAILTTRGIQLMMDPDSLKQIPPVMLGTVPLLHLMWSVATLRLLGKEFQALALKTFPAVILGPLYFQLRLQNLTMADGKPARISSDPSPQEFSESSLLSTGLHRAEEGEEPRTDDMRPFNS